MIVVKVILKVCIFIMLIPVFFFLALIAFIRGFLQSPKKRKPKRKKKYRKTFIDYYEEAIAFLDDK